MALDVTPIYRNLRTQVTFFGLEAEDLFAILAMAVVMNIFGRFLNRDMFGVPMNMVLQYFVPILSVPTLMLFKYGKQRGYLLDWVAFHTKPHVYSGLERDRELNREYIKD
jgi:hypothetical protein